MDNNQILQGMTNVFVIPRSKTNLILVSSLIKLWSIKSLTFDLSTRWFNWVQRLKPTRLLVHLIYIKYCLRRTAGSKSNQDYDFYRSWASVSNNYVHCYSASYSPKTSYFNLLTLPDLPQTTERANFAALNLTAEEQTQHSERSVQNPPFCQVRFLFLTQCLCCHHLVPLTSDISSVE